MNKHKWHKEIKAWADGAEIEYCVCKGKWKTDYSPSWIIDDEIEYRIKPQPKEGEFAHIPYWLCCGSLDPHHHKKGCSEEKAGYPERCRFGTLEQHQKQMTQPKEPQYLYVYADEGGLTLSQHKSVFMNGVPYIGKIKLEQDDE